MQIIRKNFTLKILAVALAIVGWAYIRFANNPVIAAHFNEQLTVPITTVNVPLGYVVHYTESSATVTIANKRGVPPVRAQDVKAVLDLAGRGAGVYNVPVELVAPDVAIQSLSPASVTLTLEKLAHQTARVVLHYVGNLRTGVVVSQSSTSPQNVSVSGASGAISQIAEIRTDVPIPEAPHDFDEMLRPIPVDAGGHEVDGVQVAPDLVRVQVTFVSATTR